MYVIISMITGIIVSTLINASIADNLVSTFETLGSSSNAIACSTVKIFAHISIGDNRNSHNGGMRCERSQSLVFASCLALAFSP
jgi:hypothetical protein